MNLDLDSYTYDDLLRLFKLPHNHTASDLHAAKRIVAAVHPDKSGLGSEYFIFFKKAYNTLCSLHRSEPFEEVAPQAALSSFARDKEFSTQFNTLFEQYYTKDDDGHGEWLKSSQDLDVPFDVRKRQRALVIAPSESISRSSVSNSTVGGADDYVSLKQVYTVDTVFGVSEEDGIKQPRTVSSVLAERADPIRPLSKDQARRALEAQEASMSHDYMARMYALSRQQEESSRQTGKFVGHLLRLKS